MTAIQGAGIGLRSPHFKDIIQQSAKLQAEGLWFEVLADNFLVDGGLSRDLLIEISQRFPVVLHSVGLSIGGVHPLDTTYIEGIKRLMDETGAPWYSEHLSFSGNNEFRIPDLLPLPYTEEAVRHVVERIDQVQNQLGQRILMENVSSYLHCPGNVMTEAEFMAEVASRADCYLLLDINNLFVSAFNHHSDPQEFFSVLDLDRVKQIHLAGFEHKGDVIVDAHNNPVSDEVWALFETFIEHAGPRPTLIEWDNDIPDLPRLLSERQLAAQRLNQQACAEAV